MAHHKSAEKRLRQTVKRTAINRARDSRVKSAIKSVEGAIASGKKDSAEAALKAAQPILQSGVDALGRPKKRVFGAWMLPVFRTMAKFRFLRGTLFNPFGYSEDRKLERNLIKGYEQDVVTAVKLLSPKTHDIAVELLSLPDQIRGYGPVKEASVAKAKARYEQLAKDLVDPPPLVAPQIAAE